MARGTTKSNTKGMTVEEADKAYNGLVNNVVLHCEVTKVVLNSDKVNKYSVKVPGNTSKGNLCWAYIIITEFSDQESYEVGTKLEITAHLASSMYKDKTGNNKFSTDIIIDSAKEL